MSTTNQAEQPLADMEEWDEFLVGRYKKASRKPSFANMTPRPGPA